MKDFKGNKSANVQGLEPNDNELALINKQALASLNLEDVFIFKISMSNSRVDRDFEKMSVSALHQMKEMFIGRTMIKDHKALVENQFARIYECEVIETKEFGEDGVLICELVAKVYMLNNEKNAELIAEIKAGIKKEVSIGFKIKDAICSICGQDNMKTSCEHYWGKSYEGRLCIFEFKNIVDAYEVSFVAVPANKSAGTVKALEVDQDIEKEKELILKMKLLEI